MTKKKEIKPDTFPKHAPNPLLAGLSDYLKDPANYESVQRQLLEALASPHSHSDILEWGKCAECGPKIKAHRETMKKLGFKSSAQYMAWKRVHETIKGRIPLPKYNTPQ